MFDRLTILRLKRERIDDPARRLNVQHELASVEEVVGTLARFPPRLGDLVGELADVNARLWTIEDSKRECERRQLFDAHFIALARSVYLENDHRAEIKKRINLLLGSNLIEEKFYPGMT